MNKLLIYREILNQLTLPFTGVLGTAKKGPIKIPPTVCGALLTKRCNSRCAICDYWRQNDFTDELSTNQWFNVLEQLWNIGIRLINFSADGEILTCGDCFEIMNYARNRGFDITINTNGLSMGRFTDQLKTLDPLQIQISLDALDDEIYYKVRGVRKGASTVTGNIRKLLEAGYSRVSVGSVLTRENMAELPEILKYCASNNLCFRVTAFQFMGYLENSYNLRQSYREENFILKLRATVNQLLEKEDKLNNSRYYLENMEHYFTMDKFHPLDCKVGFYKVFILPDGRVSLCNVMHQKAVAGNITEKSLEEIWYGKQADEIRRRIRKKMCPSCWLSCFAEDNMRFSPPLMAKNMSYFLQKARRMFLKDK